eukprot:592615-Rhodomonas_salina.1
MPAQPITDGRRHRQYSLDQEGEQEEGTDDGWKRKRERERGSEKLREGEREREREMRRKKSVSYTHLRAHETEADL